MVSLAISALDVTMANVALPAIAADFAGAMKGKRNLASIRDAVDSELARVKIEANAVAELIDANLVIQGRGQDLNRGWSWSIADARHRQVLRGTVPQACSARAERVSRSGGGTAPAILSPTLRAAAFSSASPVRSRSASASTTASVSSIENISGGRSKPGRRI